MTRTVAIVSKLRMWRPFVDQSVTRKARKARMSGENSCLKASNFAASAGALWVIIRSYWWRLCNQHTWRRLLNLGLGELKGEEHSSIARVARRGRSSRLMSRAVPIVFSAMERSVVARGVRTWVEKSSRLRHGVRPQGRAHLVCNSRQPMRTIGTPESLWKLRITFHRDPIDAKYRAWIMNRGFDQHPVSGATLAAFSHCKTYP